MPRRYDFSHDPTKSERSYIWSVFKEQEKGRGELDTVQLWGPGSVFVFAGPRHQFDLSPPSGVSPYDNALVDPAYRWLCDRTTGPWHWIEGETNNNRSVYCSVYLQDENDIEAFRADWGDIFKYYEQQTKDNAEYRRAEAESAMAGVLPQGVTRSALQHIFMCMSDSTADWLDGIAPRTHFDEQVSDALAKTVDDLLKAEPSEWGPMKSDGTWDEGVITTMSAIGEWVRERAPTTLRTRLETLEIEDDDLRSAFRDGSPALGSPVPGA